MPQLKRTTENSGHFHAVLIKEDDTGYTSMAAMPGDGKRVHTHAVIFTPPTPAVIDQETQQITAPERPGSISLEAADGHTHQIVEFIAVPKTEKADDDEAVKEVRQLFKTALELERASRENAMEDYQFAQVEQWDIKDRQSLKTEKKACLTIDKITGKLDILSGYQRQNRKDIKYYPRKGGNQVVADIFSQATKVIWDWNNADYAETEVFEDQMNVGRGIYNCYISYENTLDGEIVIEKFPWDGVLFGPHEKKDATDLEYLLKFKWVSFNQLESEYPDKAELIQRDSRMTFGLESADTKIQRPGRQYDVPEVADNVVKSDTANVTNLDYKDPDFVNIANRNYLKVECHRIIREHIPMAVFKGEIDPDDGKPPVYSLDGYDPKEIAAIKQMPDVSIVKQPHKYVKITTVAGTIKLDEERSTFSMFSVIPVYAKKFKDNWFGKIKNLKDPQRDVNKRRSQITNIINKTAGYPEFYDANTFPPGEEKNYQRNANTAGHLQKVNDINNVPRQKEGIKFPSEIATLEKESAQDLAEISNIPPEMQGMVQSQQSSKSLMAARSSALLGNEFLFDNLALGKRQVGRWLLQAIPQVYTSKSIMKLLDYSKEQGQEVQIAGQPADQYSEEQLEKYLQEALNGNLNKYDVKVDESNAAPTKRYETMVKLMELQASGAQLPQTLLLEYVDLPPDVKKRALAEIQAQQQAALQAEQDKNKTEIAKTILANQNKQQPAGGGQPAQQ